MVPRDKTHAIKLSKHFYCWETSIWSVTEYTNIFFFLLFFFFETLSPGWPQTFSVAKDGFKHLILLLAPPKCWDYRVSHHTWLFCWVGSRYLAQAGSKLLGSGMLHCACAFQTFNPYSESFLGSFRFLRLDKATAPHSPCHVLLQRRLGELNWLLGHIALRRNGTPNQH